MFCRSLSDRVIFFGRAGIKVYFRAMGNFITFCLGQSISGGGDYVFSGEAVFRGKFVRVSFHV